MFGIDVDLSIGLAELRRRLRRLFGTGFRQHVRAIGGDMIAYFLADAHGAELGSTHRAEVCRLRCAAWQGLVVKGAGAGAEVTASGVFADILRTIN